MIKKVTIRNFKLLQEEIFNLKDTIVLAGPNNKGKTTALQAIATWRLALGRWREQKFGSRAKKRKGVAITRKDFTVVPLREFNLLWHDRSAFLKAAEGKPGAHRLIEIELVGEDFDLLSQAKQEWALTMALRYQGPEMAYAYPVVNIEGGEEIPEGAKKLNLVHVPCFSGIGVEETRYDRAWQDKLIGQGKPGDILRNLLLELYENEDKSGWNELKELIQNIFGYTILPPVYSAEITTSITCEFLPGVPAGKGMNGLTRLDIASAGSGFLQTLILFSFFIARPSTVLLLDEPDAHLHVILQHQVYDLLKSQARKKGCQLIVATHSEVIIDTTSPSHIISFFPKPHPLTDEFERDQVREAIKRVSSQEMMGAEQTNVVMYMENESDFKILREFSKLLDHPTQSVLAEGLFHPLRGYDPRQAKGHFFALRAINAKIKGLVILDRDNRDLPQREVAAQGLEIIRWGRYEIENYLLLPGALERFCAEGLGAKSEPLLAAIQAKQVHDYFQKQFPPPALEHPLENSTFFVNVRASKDLLPLLFSQLNIDLDKNDYFMIVPFLNKEEAHPDIINTLNLILTLSQQGKNKELK
ncbi:MAG TPA: AAA family ATPase [bacterium]|nr:AAA family ATPase [bacterium]